MLNDLRYLAQAPKRFIALCAGMPEQTKENIATMANNIKKATDRDPTDFIVTNLPQVVGVETGGTSTTPDAEDHVHRAYTSMVALHHHAPASTKINTSPAALHIGDVLFMLFFI